MEISSFVSLTGVSIGILAILVSIFKQKGSSFKKFSFLLMLAALTYYCFMVFVNDSGLIFKFPHLFKSGSPIFYLLAISTLWVGQSHLLGKERLSRWDYALLLIPIFHFIELLPFYFKSATEKMLYLQGLFVDRDQIIYSNEGWIPTVLHYLFPLLMGFGISIYMLFLIGKRKKENKGLNTSLNWVQLFFLVFLVFNSSGLGLLFFDSVALPIHKLASWLFGLMLVVQLFLLFLMPEILYALPSSNDPYKSPATPPVQLDDEEAEFYRQRLEEYFKTKNDYLRTDFRQQQLAEHLGIPKSRLSQIINQLFDQNFNQLINDKRIEVALEKIHSQAWKNLTFEGIAQEIGFKSRTTFYKAFQEKTGITPSQFRKQPLKA